MLGRNNSYRSVAVLVLASAFFFFGFVALVHAQVSVDLPGSFAGFSSQDLKKSIENIVRIVLGFVGVIFILLMLYGGFVWMTSAGEPDKINKAKKIIASAVIGLLVTLSSYAIARFVIRSLGEAVSPSSSVPGGGGFTGFGVALGAGVLESHYPGRNATGIPRNTNIFVTFKEDMKEETFCDYISGPGGTCAIGGAACATNAACGVGNYCIGLVNVGSVKIGDVNNPISPDPLDPNNDNELENVICLTQDRRTFKLDPDAIAPFTDYLGTSNSDTLYRVQLTSAIQKANNTSALGVSGYSWLFTVSSIVDLTPPYVASVFPSGGVVARNAIVQINFSEPVDPTTSSGIHPPYVNITLDDPVGPPPIDGAYSSNNQYATTEFIPNEQCGQNACGIPVFCLPGGLLISGTVTPAISDMAGNFLDGNNDGTSGDPYNWSFTTTNDLDLTPPFLISRVPHSGDVDVSLSAPIEMKFSELLANSSLNSFNMGYGWDSAWVPPNAPSSGTWNDGINFWISADNTTDNNGDGFPDTTAYLSHDPYAPLTPYHPGMSSDITDAYQNCFYPGSCDINGDNVITGADDINGDALSDIIDCQLAGF